ncbi:Ankyrin repeats (3 copies) [Candidatus Rubidus massiliensis]|nr:Ankyrin repeats (3 copies) [Candidatus Rubidus massiliensis]
MEFNNISGSIPPNKIVNEQIKENNLSDLESLPEELIFELLFKSDENLLQVNKNLWNLKNKITFKGNKAIDEKIINFIESYIHKNKPEEINQERNNFISGILKTIDKAALTSEQFERLIDLFISKKDGPSLSLIAQNPFYDREDLGIKMLFFAAETGDAKLTSILAKDEMINLAAEDNEAFVKAAENGHLFLLELLTDSTNPNTNNVDVADQENAAIRAASKNGHADVVRYLLTFEEVDPSAEDNEALLEAVRAGHTEVVEELIKDERVAAPDMLVFYQEAIAIAREEQKEDIFQLLLQNPNIS